LAIGVLTVSEEGAIDGDEDLEAVSLEASLGVRVRVRGWG